MQVVFFDGNCPMCHSWVKRIIRWDRKNQFRFSPLEGDLAGKLLSPLLPDYLKEDTIVFYDDGHIYLRSDAAFKIVGMLGFPYNLLAAGRVFPKGLRDLVYRKIAANRYRFGERYSSCPVPPPEWRELFIQ
jgi:predicted DCC family thiol-disulfide oxidoreductase YuxK